MKPRILMIISFFYPHLGGAEQQALRLAEGLYRKGICVSVLTRRFKGLASHEIIQGIPIYRNIRTFPWGKWFALTYMLSVFWFLLRKWNTYDIIHCHLLQGFHSIVAIMFKVFFRKNVIIKVGATGPISDFIMIKKVLGGDFLLKQITRADRLITVCSQSTAEALQEGFSTSQIVQIPNGVDTNYFKPCSPSPTQKDITFIGRLDYLKGVHVLIEALTKLKTGGFAANLNIIGDGPDRDRLKTLARDKGVLHSIRFHGETEDILPYLQKSALFVLPSLSEGLSNVLLEAMACGLPVIATRVGGTPDIIQDHVNGLLVDPEDPERLSEMMQTVLMNPEQAECLGMQARKTIEQRFSLDTMVNRYISLYQELMDSR